MKWKRLQPDIFIAHSEMYFQMFPSSETMLSDIVYPKCEQKWDLTREHKPEKSN